MSKNYIVYTLLIPVLFLIYAFIQQIILGKELGINPMPDSILIVLLLLTLALAFFVCNLKLITKIYSDKIVLKYIPIFSKKYKFEDIKELEVLDYGFVGGWGIRLYTKHGTVYNVKGSKGLFIKMKSGKKLVIGTQQEENLKKVILELKKVNAN